MDEFREPGIGCRSEPQRRGGEDDRAHDQAGEQQAGHSERGPYPDPEASSPRPAAVVPRASYGFANVVALTLAGWPAHGSFCSGAMDR
jgi:hypothetical protein